MKFFILTILLTPTLGQYMADLAMKPDVTFGEQNDRFDLSALMQDQNKFSYRQSDEDYRRKYEIIQTDQKKLRDRKDIAESFGYHDSDGGDFGTAADFEENLKKLQAGKSRRFQDLVAHLHGQIGKAGRRSNRKITAKEPEKEILMHHAVPIDMTIDGFLQAPLVK